MRRQSFPGTQLASAVLSVLVVTSLGVLVAPTLTATATTTASNPPGDVHVVDDDIGSLAGTPCDGARYPTIGDAVTAASAGDVITVCAGNYTEQVDVGKAGLTIEAVGDARVHSIDGWAFQIRAPDVTVRGFEILATGAGGFEIRGRNATIRNNYIYADEKTDKTGGTSTGGSAPADYPPGVMVAAFHEATGAQGVGVLVYANDSVIRGNTVDGHTDGMKVWGAHDAVIRNNVVKDPLGGDRQDGVIIIGNSSARVIGNTFTQNEDGIVPAGNVTIVGNNISGNQNDGVDIGPEWGVNVTGKTARVRVINNQIRNNGASGILLRRSDWKPDDIVIERNFLMGNAYHGINNEEVFFDNEHQVVNATGNYWGCGGPSSGLEDPYTDRVANGSGDSISPSKTPGESNVHFDPFFERSSCVTGGSTPSPSPEPTTTGSPTSTATATATATAGGRTETATATGTATPTSTAGTGGGPGQGNGSTAVRTVSGPGENDLGQLETTDTPTPLQTPTPSPTATLPPTETPTPRAEPGFGVLTWVVGLVGLVGLLGLRQRRDRPEDG